MPIEKAPFGTTKDGQAATLFTLTNANGLIARLTDLGATLVEMHTPDRNGQLADITFGFDDVSGYQGEGNDYFGCTVGRICNRTGLARFTLDGREYQLAVNDGANHLHGGLDRAFSRVMWNAEPGETDRGPAVKFNYTSPDGEENYPGTVDATVTCTLTNTDELRIDYSATTDQPTPLNLTNHAYWNLAGAGGETILDHMLSINGSQHLVATDDLIATGEIRPVAGTSVDFTTSHAIGERIDQATADYPGGGYDLTYVIDKPEGQLGPAARVSEPTTGRVLEVFTDQPVVQFYSGNFLRGQAGKPGQTYPHRSGLCLECHLHPNAANVESFPDIILRPGQTYRQTTVHKFSTE